MVKIDRLMKDLLEDWTGIKKMKYLYSSWEDRRPSVCFKDVSGLRVFHPEDLHSHAFMFHGRNLPVLLQRSITHGVYLEVIDR